MVAHLVGDRLGPAPAHSPDQLAPGQGAVIRIDGHLRAVYRDATQTVFGERPADTRLFMVGEQPGDAEDREGEPFVGPAGRFLNRALETAGIDRDRVYVTNAVKHFKFTPTDRGNRRLHKKPTRGEALACRPWLLAELRAVRPALVVALGATAAQALKAPARPQGCCAERLPAPASGSPECERQPRPRNAGTTASPGWSERCCHGREAREPHG
ncbi:uracil-DNA glycosylase family protein [Glycomyces mayteni]|uniref:Uracil-DNA glycosylase family protein n=1 Tax=Glycomyces mayteni TaxID=543887 RepID=A0ABW2D8J3_9ACTN